MIMIQTLTPILTPSPKGQRSVPVDVTTVGWAVYVSPWLSVTPGRCLKNSIVGGKTVCWAVSVTTGR